MKSFRHEYVLYVDMHSTVQDFEDHSADFIIQTLEEQVAKIKADKKNWIDHVGRCKTTEAAE